MLRNICGKKFHRFKEFSVGLILSSEVQNLNLRVTSQLWAYIFYSLYTMNNVFIFICLFLTIKYILKIDPLKIYLKKWTTVEIMGRQKITRWYVTLCYGTRHTSVGKLMWFSDGMRQLPFLFKRAFRPGYALSND